MIFGNIKVVIYLIVIKLVVSSADTKKWSRHIESFQILPKIIIKNVNIDRFFSRNALMQLQSNLVINRSLGKPDINNAGKFISSRLRALRRRFDNSKAMLHYHTAYNVIQPTLKDLITSLHREPIRDIQCNNETINENNFKENRKLDTEHLMNKFSDSLQNFESKLYQTVFNNLLSISPPDRRENGISFIQSGLFLYMALMTISLEVDKSTTKEIENSLGYNITTEEKILLLKNIISWLPNSSSTDKFRWASRLVLDTDVRISQQFEEVAEAVHVRIDSLNGSVAPDVLTKSLNCMVEGDSGGAMHNTFDESELSQGMCSVLLNTMYVRPRWRSAPTVLNGTRPFHDTAETPQRYVRMIRINDIVQYASLDEYDADAVEINYTTPGLTLLLLVPRGHSIRSLAKLMANASLNDIIKRMNTIRIAVTIPIYTLRMTLLLPEKLRTIGISRLVDTKKGTNCNKLRLSHAVQRLMYWAEAGKNAFKDDGIEWDESPQFELVVDRPYLFYVRWKNITMLNGNFVL